MFENELSPFSIFKSFIHYTVPALETKISKTKNGYIAKQKDLRMSYSFLSNEVLIEKKEPVYVGGMYEDMWQEEDRFMFSLTEDGNLRATRK